MYFGCNGSRCSASKAGLKRSMWPTWKHRPRLLGQRDQFVGLAEDRRSTASRPARGTPRDRKSAGDGVMGERRGGDHAGVHQRQPAADVRGRPACCSAGRRPRPGRRCGSATPTSSTSGSVDRMRACSLPRWPTPTTAIRRRFMRSPHAHVGEASGGVHPRRLDNPPGMNPAARHRLPSRRQRRSAAARRSSAARAGSAPGRR